jgi:large subunit ribosomal protein L25
MSNIFEFIAKNREISGKSSARATRRQGHVPAIIYGCDLPPVKLTLDHNEIIKHLENEAVYSHILDLTIDGKTEKAVLKDLQRHPAKPQILHLDFMRINEAEHLKIHVPLHFINESDSIGVKKGGVATHSRVEIEISCLPSALPEYLDVDLINLDLGESIHLSEITLPTGVEIIELAHGEKHDLAVASIIASRVAQDDDVDSDDEEESVSE